MMMVVVAGFEKLAHNEADFNTRQPIAQSLG